MSANERYRRPRLQGAATGACRAWSVSDGSLEALKWVGLLLMTGDHANKYLLQEASVALYALGRLAMPLFGFVLMAHLARPGARQAGVHGRVMRRLAVLALLATPAFVQLVGWWPLNILATLWLATLIVWLIEQGGRARGWGALAAFLAGGAVVEFWWPGLLCCLCAWAFLRRPSAPRLLLWVLATASLSLINGNFAALAALPLTWGAGRIEMPVPRSRWFFYAFYPVHLSVIALVQPWV